MSTKKTINNGIGPSMINPNNNDNAPKVISDQDFEFVQMDKTIHDVRFDTKPTSFMGDAMKRFIKNRSSVVASVILGILIGFAILVPIVNTSNIETPHSEYMNLPPRCFDVNSSGFMDGTTSIKGVVGYDTTGPVTAETDLANVLPAGDESFRPECIVPGSLKSSWALVGSSTEYGYGGSYGFRAGNHHDDPSTFSPYSIFDVAVPYTISVSFDREAIAQEAIQPEYSLFANVYFDPAAEAPTRVSLYTPAQALDYSDVSINTVSDLISAAIPSGTIGTSFRTAFGLSIKTNKEYDVATIGSYPCIYLTSFQIGRTDGVADGTYSTFGFTDGNEMYRRSSSADVATKARAWSTDKYGTTAISGVHYIVCEFRYDNYKHAFGEKRVKAYSFTDAQKYIDKGWMSLDRDNASSFQILDDKCPIRSVSSIKVETFPYTDENGKTKYSHIYTLDCVVSLYREYGFSEMPSYFFGTDKNGWDYFKYLFSGLSTSLLLGVLAAAINISFGLVWGSISGYFGGWTDILMERFTEILGGMPWIVVMTLCILTFDNQNKTPGQGNFGGFLIALCITGWLGVAAEAREQFYRYKGREYVLASRTLGASDARLIFKHILPNGIGTIVTGSVLMIPGVIFSEATISYLGLGLKGMKSFGVALSQAQGQLSDQPYLIVCGSIIVSVLMICFNLFGNGLRDAFNPSLKGANE